MTSKERAQPPVAKFPRRLGGFLGREMVSCTQKEGLPMSLGENIYRLRTAKNMSQGDLADTLGVSRQSVSKRETDGATPDLDKLVKLSELFGVTLDELVKGETPRTGEAPPPPVMVVRGMEKRLVAGFVLLAIGLSILPAFAIGTFNPITGVMALPFLLPALVCLTVRNKTEDWCGVAVVAALGIILLASALA